MFAEDEGTQFLGVALLTSPMLKAPINGPGAALRVSWGDWRYGFGVHAPGGAGAIAIGSSANCRLAGRGADFAAPSSTLASPRSAGASSWAGSR